MSVATSTLGSAAAGAAAGSMFGPWGAAIGGGLGLLSGFLGGREQEAAAEAQQQMGMAQLQQAQADRRFALGLAGASPTELMGQQQMLGLQSQILGRTNRELEFLSSGLNLRSPAAADMGQGLFSEYIMRSRGVERQNLEANLRRRFGSGYATTSAGAAALSQFDQGTADIGVRAIPTFLETAYGAIQKPMEFENLIRSRQVNAFNQNPIAQYAGAPFLGQAIRAQNTAADINELFRTGVSTAIQYGLSKKT